MKLAQTQKTTKEVEMSAKEIKKANENIKKIYAEIKGAKEYKENILKSSMDLTRQAKLLNRINYTLNELYSMLAFYEQQFNAIEGNTSAEIYMDKGLNREILDGMTLETYDLA